MAVPVNPFLPSSYLVPGVYMYLNLNSTGPTQANRRALILGYKGSLGTAQYNIPVKVNNQEEANTLLGQGSMTARAVAAFQSQLIGGAGAELFVCPVPEPSGAKATHTITFQATAKSDGTIDTNTTAMSSGYVDIYIAGYRSSTQISNGDTFSTIAANALIEINKLLDIPVTAGVGSATITLTDRHFGIEGNDCPVIVSFSNPQMKVGAVAGTLTFAAGPNTAGTGAVTIVANTKTLVVSIANNNTDTQSATATVVALNGNAFPLTGGYAAGVVSLYYAQDRVVHRISASITASIAPQTATLVVGTAGSGSVNLTTAITNIGASDAFKVWVSCFNDATSLGALDTTIENYAVSPFDKGQTLHFCSTQSLSVAGAIPLATTPLLTATPRAIEDWCAGSPQQAYEIAGRTGAIVVSTDYVPLNYDGFQLRTANGVPLLNPHIGERPSLTDQNTAMATYYMTPIVVNALAQLVILRGVTTFKPGDLRLSDWSTILTLDYYRDDLKVYLYGLFKGKSIKVFSEPRTTNCVKPQNVKDAVFGRLLFYDNIDYFDGAAQLKDLVQANVDVLVPTRIDVSLPMRPPANLHQISLYGNLVN